MPCIKKSATLSVKKSNREPDKKDRSSIKEKMEMLNEKVLDDLLS